jgi:D-alanine-D-alanine ligase
LREKLLGHILRQLKFNRAWMTRIGFAYNQKPERQEQLGGAEFLASRGDDKPPSMRRDIPSRNSVSASARTDASLATPATASAPTTVANAATLLAGADEFAEWDAPATIDAVEHALAQCGEVVRLEATLDFPAALRDAQPDIVFNIAEGLHGVNREAHVPAICEFVGVPYSGSDPFTLSLCLHKARTKEVLSFHGVPNARFVLATSGAELRAVAQGKTALRAPSAQTPLFVKPVHEGSSKGITERNFVTSPSALLDQGGALIAEYDQPVLVEEFLPGAEFTCGVLGNGGEARVLPIVAINFDSLPEGAVPIYGYEAKWIWDRPDRPLEIFECPASIPDSLRAAIERVVLRAYQVLGCRDWSRIDVRLDAAGEPHIVEVNPLPGILPDPADNSCLPKAARAAGISYDALIQKCLRHACERSGVELPLPASRAMRPRLEGAA